jgi:hypothetical protein
LVYLAGDLLCNCKFARPENAQPMLELLTEQLLALAASAPAYPVQRR